MGLQLSYRISIHNLMKEKFMKRSERLAQYASICDRLDNAIDIRIKAREKAIFLNEKIPSESYEISILAKGLRMARFRHALAAMGLLDGDTDGTEMLHLRLLVDLERKITENPGESFSTYQYQTGVARRMRLEQAVKVYEMDSLAV